MPAPSFMVPSMLFTSGYWRRGHTHGVPIRWHWSLLVGLALAGAFGLAPLAWLLYLGLVQCHLMGHALAIRKARLTPVGVDIQGLGGKVRWRGHATAADEVRASWAGVLAQLVPLVIAKVIVAAYGGVTTPWLADLERVWVDMNAILIGVSLLPLPTFDGEVAWKVFAMARGVPVERRRVLVVEEKATVVAPQDPLAVAEEVAREVRSLAQAHNDRAGVG